MIGYVTLGTNDLEKARAFYDALLKEFNATHMMDEETFTVWMAEGTQGGGLMVTKPYDGKPANVGNGVMAALAAPSNEAVDRIYAKALELGGKDEGAPGDRGNGFYAAYFRDLDGNKLNAFHMG